jgi:hypothetical protein
MKTRGNFEIIFNSKKRDNFIFNMKTRDNFNLPVFRD